jgi:predicted amidohydrolase YtcJ
MTNKWIKEDSTVNERDTIFVNGTVRTLHPETPTASAVLVHKGKVLAVGERADMRELAKSDFQEVDLAGSTLLPGFIESHNHFLMAGLQASQIDLHPSKCPSIKSVQRRLAMHASGRRPGQWIIGRGYDHAVFEEQRHITRYDIDDVVPDHPVILYHGTLKALVANSLALQMAGFDRGVEQVKGGEIQLGEDGQPTGVLFEIPAMTLVTQLIPPPSAAELRTALANARDLCLSRGITAIHDALIERPEEVEAYGSMIASGELPIRATLMLDPTLYAGEFLGLHGDLTTVYGVPENRLAAGPVKLFQDGRFQAHTAALTEGYYDEPSMHGTKVWDPDHLVAKVRHFHEQGLQVAIHANGDAAIDDVLDSFEEALAASPRSDHRHRIEHCQTARPDQLRRMARLSVGASMFINHLWQFGDRHINQYLGPERAATMNPLRTMTELGIPWGLHSDHPVTDINPLLSIWLAVNRRTSSGAAIGTDENVSVEKALRGFGPDAAWLGFQENVIGTIKPGFAADFVALSADPTENPESIKDINVRATIFDGEVVYVTPE